MTFASFGREFLILKFVTEMNVQFSDEPVKVAAGDKEILIEAVSVLVMAVILLFYMIQQAHGWGPILAEPGRFPDTGDFLRHLPIFLTNNTMLYVQQNNPLACCVIGYHGAAHVPGGGGGATNGNGNQGVNTFVYASYTTPGTFSQRSGYFVKDIHSLGHEVAEWGDDPFIDNTVEPWLTPTAPQYGCTGLLETGDPVVGIGFNIGSNSYAPNAFADGAYHPEDEVFMQWFYRVSPSNAQPEQGSSSGRYTLMGKLNPYPSFRMPATGC